MATWQDLIAFVRTEYRVIEDGDDELRILIEYEDGRSQVIILAHEVLDSSEDWVQVASVCGRVADVDLKRLLEEIGQTSVVCGAAIMGDHVVLRHALPLENLDINEFTDPLTFVADTADQLEEMFFGGDGY
ncbi:hypothetical protein A8924_1507 [Saccharopolyspora erythraea NRRL 2338]|uniref:Uncharacterized protein n=2 Tax=Saccharopolyspora erythraea TaxID=1836 RepID=A4F8R7_SACEN|nr:hypothetical protein [Saccharopolyspora erythraea]EQD86756.1 hypothetical protein N599_08075 [Saccharopolyspora erythraea D]PFG94237.1 hypothetical protein A8924_1507 [Saccharopolyspora erythraea NRRL 2338]QRK91011.1 hypothetical protein JQX30_06080 [Saccharopolyspora erythraea]CAM00442.1 hypothetical protein SACE_1111 [Saccharopolyspora erythraea NRRL 2338]